MQNKSSSTADFSEKFPVESVSSEETGPRRFSKAELETFAELYGRMEETLETALGRLLRTEVLVNFRGAEQTRFQHFLTLHSFILAARPVNSPPEGCPDSPPVEGWLRSSRGGSCVFRKGCQPPRPSGIPPEEGNDGPPWEQKPDWPTVFMNLPEAIISPMLDRILGADADDAAQKKEPRTCLTTLEEKLTERILAGVYRGMEDAWRPLVPVSFRGTRLEAVPFTANFVVLHYSLTLLGISGTISFAFPCGMVAGLLSLMEAEAEKAKFPSSGGVPEGWGDQNHHAVSPDHPVGCAATPPEEGNLLPAENVTPETPPAPAPENPDMSVGIAAALRNSLVDVSVRLLGGNVMPGELLDWKIGDVIHLNRSEKAEFGVFVEGTEEFSAVPEVYQQRKVIRIVGKK